LENDTIYRRLIDLAYEAKERAYVPYSHFPVGAALMTSTGEIYTGCNIEIASYGATNCAERTAIFKAVSDGHTQIQKIAIVSNIDGTYPCGICRQVIAEFADEIEIIIGNHETYKVYSLEDLLPHAFTKKELDRMEEHK
jgi:cytidine deaminase